MAGLIILCPGQGRQHQNMFRFSPTSISALETYLTAPFSKVMQSPELPFKNQNAQVLVVAATYGNWLALKPHIPEPIAFLGYSVGELTAFSCAGAINAQDVLPLAQQRVHLMDNVKIRLTEPMGLLAVTGTYRNAVSQCCQEYQVHVAIKISSSSFVLGGLQSHLKDAYNFMVQCGAHAQILPIDVASHTPLMNDASVEFNKVLAATHLNEPFLPVISSLTGEKMTTETQAKTTLAQQLPHTLNFDHALQVVSELLPSCVLELGPGTALSKMFQQHNPKVPCRSMEDFRTIKGVANWIRKFTD